MGRNLISCLVDFLGEVSLERERLDRERERERVRLDLERERCDGVGDGCKWKDGRRVAANCPGGVKPASKQIAEVVIKM